MASTRLVAGWLLACTCSSVRVGPAGLRWLGPASLAPPRAARTARARPIAGALAEEDGSRLPAEVVDTRPQTSSLLDTMASALVESDARGRLRSKEEAEFVDALVDAVRAGRAEELPLLAREKMGVLISPRYIALVREKLAASPSAEDAGALLELNEFVVSIANSTQNTLSEMHARQLAKVQALCAAAARGGNVALDALARELHERNELDGDFVNWLSLAIQAAEAEDGGVPSRWTLVLRLIRQGVHSILEQDYAEDIATLRAVMALPPAGRKDMLWTTLAEMPVDSARHFDATVSRILGSLSFERDGASRQLHAEVRALYGHMQQWFDSPFYRAD